MPPLAYVYFVSLCHLPGGAGEFEGVSFMAGYVAFSGVIIDG